MSSAFQSQHQQPRRWRDIGRLAGCFWMMLAAWSLVGVVTAFGVGIDASPILLPLAVVPLMFALFVAIGGRFLSVLAISAVAALAFAGLGA